MSGLRTSLDPERDRVTLRREGGRATFWLTRGEIQHLWQHYRPDQPVRTHGTFPLDEKTARIVGDRKL